MTVRLPSALKRRIPAHIKYDLKNCQSTLELGCKILTGKIVRLFRRPPFPATSGNTINLHLGCGSINHPLFINIDAIPAPHIHYVRRIDSLSPFEDNSVDLIYACHCLEHLPFAEIPRVLREWYRVLKTSGILRLSVPDFDLILDLYKDNNNDITMIIPPLMGGQDYKYNYHNAIFNKSYLASLLTQCGFCGVSEWEPGSSELTTFDDWSNRRILINNKEYPVSLNLEAVK